MGSKARIFAHLVYSGSNNPSLLPSSSSSSILTVPLSSNFKVLLSRYEKQLYNAPGRMPVKGIRATERAFGSIAELGKRHQFLISDIAFSRGSQDVVNIRDDPAISQEFYDRLSSDQSVTLTRIGFSKGSSKVQLDVQMRLALTNIDGSSAGLIFDIFTSVLEDGDLYQDLDSAFISKRDDTWPSSVNPVVVQGNLVEPAQLEEHLRSNFPKDDEFGLSGRSAVYFSSQGGTWGEILVTGGEYSVFFRSEVEFDFGVHLLNVLGRVMK